MNSNVKNLLSPSKRYLIQEEDEEDQEKNLRISSKLKKIIVENTPTPYLIKKFSKRSELEIAEAYSLTSKQNYGIIPNTPSISSSLSNTNKANQTQNKRLKRLLNVNDYYNEDFLPGLDENDCVKNQHPKNITNLNDKPHKISNLFKPKTSTGKIDEDFGSNESFDTLQKLQRRRKNQYVVRKSEVFKNLLESSDSKSDMLPPPQIPSIAIQPAQPLTENRPQSEQSAIKIRPNDVSNIFDLTASSTTNSNNLNSTEKNSDQLKFPTTMITLTPILNQNETLSRVSNNHSDFSETDQTFTKITKQMYSINSFEEQTGTTNTDSPNRTAKNIDKKQQETSLFSNLEPNDIYTNEKTPEKQFSQSTRITNENDETVDQFINQSQSLFDGLKIDSSKKPAKENSLNDETSKEDLLVTKPPVSKKLQLNKPNDAKATNSKTKNGLTDKTNMLKKKNDNINIKEIHSKIPVNEQKDSKLPFKRYKMLFINLSENQMKKLRSIANKLSNASSLNTNNEVVKLVLQESFSFQTTHLIFDYEKTFKQKGEYLTTFKRFLFVLAAINKCKLIRYEWLVDCNRNEMWLNEKDYLIDSCIYLNEQTHCYESDFDYKLCKLIEKIEVSAFNHKLFSSLKNIYIVIDKRDDPNASTCVLDQDDEKQTTMATIFKDLFFKDTSFGLKNNSLYDYLNELILKCGGNITSRVRNAESIIVIDRTIDLDESKDYEQIENEKILFEKSIEGFNRLIQKSYNGVDVISSEWILESILDNRIIDRNDYVIKHFGSKKMSK